MVVIQPSHGALVTSSAEILADAPRAVLRFGTAPDGLPWLLEVDRTAKIESLFSTVLRVFELRDREELPDGVRSALERDVAAGLMGVHQVELAVGVSPARVYVSRQKAKHLLGPTIFSQVLEGAPKPKPSNFNIESFDEPRGYANTSVGAIAVSEQDLELVEAVERSIQDRKAKRHLLIELSTSNTWTGSVRPENKALRSPGGPFVPLLEERLSSLPGALAVFQDSGGQWRTLIGDVAAYQAALIRAHQNYGGAVSFEIPYAALLSALVHVARAVHRVHQRGRVHGDLAPGNILVADDGARAFDSLEIEVGAPATAATFEWAAPEQIVGHGVDARTDVFALGKMAARIIGAVPFGEETHYIVPIGGKKSRRVQLLKCEGVFLDILETTHARSWQMAWQELIGDSLAYDRKRRPVDAEVFADRLEALLEEHPPSGMLSYPGVFGEPRRLEHAEGWSFGRLVRD